MTPTHRDWSISELNFYFKVNDFDGTRYFVSDWSSLGSRGENHPIENRPSVPSMECG